MFIVPNTTGPYYMLFYDQIAAMKTAVDAATGGYPFLPIVYKRFLNGYKGVCDSAIKGLIRHWEWRKEVFIVNNNFHF